MRRTTQALPKNEQLAEVAISAGSCRFRWGDNSRSSQFPANVSDQNHYVRPYPHDGMDSLGAFVEAIAFGLFIEIAAGILLYVLQRKISSRSIPT